MRLPLHYQDDLRGGTSDMGTLSVLSLIGEQARTMDEDTTKKAYDERLRDVIAGRAPHYRSIIADAVTGTKRIDRITAELLIHAGCDPAALLAIAIVLEYDPIFEQEQDEALIRIDAYRSSEDDGVETWVQLAHDVRWYADGSMDVGIPDTVAHASVGRRLHEIVSHPVLDRHRLKVTGMEMDGITIRLLTNSPRRPLTARQLLRMGPGTGERQCTRS